MQICPEDFHKFSTTQKLFQGNNNAANIPAKPGTVVTDILIRGGGGTITFSDNVTVEFFFGFIPDDTVPGGGRFGITLEENSPRAQLLYQNVLTQGLCDTIDWLLQCSDLARRVAILELTAGIGIAFRFTVADWNAGDPNEITIIQSGVPVSPGQLGPHNLGTGRIFNVHVWRETGATVALGIDLELEVNLTTGNVILRKAPRAPAFDGRVILS